MSRLPDDARYQRAIGFLYGRIDYERGSAMSLGQPELRLERMSRLLAAVGNPQSRLPIVHIAGTKGKGSTAAMTSSVLVAAGFRCGLFSSPHLVRIEERIAIDNRPCSAGEFASLVEQLQPVVAMMDADARTRAGEIGPTFFELTTVMALLHFVQQNVDFAVLEVGLGGRLDSTNVCQPRVSVITSISFDHTQQLGSTLAAIAGEKAGIVKPGVPVVSGVIAAEPRAVIERICQQRGAPLKQLGVDFDFEYRPPRLLDQQATAGEIDFRAVGEPPMQPLQIGLVGRHQAANASLVVQIVRELRTQGWPISDAAVASGLATFPWPARVEVVARNPTIVIDAAHNIASMEALLTTLDESFTADRRVLIFASTLEKDVRGMLSLLAGRFDRVLLTQYHSNPRAFPVAQLAQLAAEVKCTPLEVYATPALAWQAIRGELGDHDLVCATGSFFLAAEFRAALELP